MLRFAFKLSNDKEMAKDACQDVWLKSAKTLYKLRDPRAFKSWMYRTVRWRTLDLLRRHKTQKTSLDNEVSQDELENFSIHTDFAADINNGNSILNHGISALPPLERQVIHLFYLDDMSVVEVSLILEIPTGTVKSRLNRARQLLKQKLENNDYEH
ncbi:sigma-70 family RNA polymerase sigma factor [Paraglaciecola aquimarina]|uniref:Sigma-70 family RNA polymerase sigma factor n=1 Tax=Paraglaciecola aquimarina TaxID=1235557 RepID=A0ABU3SYJ4_9ALTE|nr:sigma-70 family RNA polymerase sigma factor [Paraglaciecola aquimarina]MDU0355076.1 sigma-70 family RNA polymerase sigma factor [Paraglaciecola aquimarina]